MNGNFYLFDLKGIFDTTSKFEHLFTFLYVIPARMKFTNEYDKQLLVEIISVKFVRGNFLQQHVTAMDCFQVFGNVASDEYYLPRDILFIQILTLLIFLFLWYNYTGECCKMNWLTYAIGYINKSGHVFIKCSVVFLFKSLDQSLYLLSPYRVWVEPLMKHFNEIISVI